MNRTITSVTVRYEEDIVAVRQRSRDIAGLLGFDGQDQTRLATAVSEIARNAFKYAGGGRVDFDVEGKTSPQLLCIRVVDTGPGIPELEAILGGRYHSATGMGLGILGARRLVDHFRVESAPGRTVVEMCKLLPARAPLVTAARLSRIAGELARRELQTPLEEIRQQNQELVRTLDTLRVRQEELERLNAELQDTNRGVVALYAELDEKADHLRRADELKSRFLSNMSHEFRTPLNAIRALTHVLLNRMDGPLTPEQEKQIGYVRRAAEELTEIVDDLLDLAKVEAGKTVVRPAEFEVGNLFGALRGMLRPLLVSDQVTLVFEETPGLPLMRTDEAKVSQILRNLISNALKFTERGDVRVSAALDDDRVVFAVTDTGIGIAPEDQERIFQEFGQLEHPLQRRVRGTGLGLPLSRRLAHLLGGTLTVTSAVGVGSTFRATIPVVYREPAAEPLVPTRVPPTSGLPVLVVEDRPEEMLVYEKFLRGSGFQVVPAVTPQQARQALKQSRPVAIILDILLRGQDAWGLLADLKADAETRDIPIVVVTTVDDERKGRALGADAYAVKPVERRWLLDQLGRLTGRRPPCRVLVIDDEEVSRYLARDLLDQLPCVVADATSGGEGLRKAREEQPDAIVLDLVMPDLSGQAVLDQLRADPATRAIPVLVFTSKDLDEEERAALARDTVAIISKGAPREVAVAAVQAALLGAGLVESPA